MPEVWSLLLGAVSMQEVTTKAFNPAVSVFIFGFVFAHLYRPADLGSWVLGAVLRLSGGSQPLVSLSRCWFEPAVQMSLVV